MNLREIRPEDIDNILLQNKQAYMRLLVDDVYKETVSKSPVSFTLEDEGIVIGCGGIIKFWEGSGEAWTLLSAHAHEHMTRITRIVRRVLDGSGFHRIQMTTDEGFTEAERWARMLGFEHEGLMRKYHADGRNVNLWARIR